MRLLPYFLILSVIFPTKIHFLTHLSLQLTAYLEIQF